MSESPESPVFAPVPSELDFPAAEARTLAFWKERGIFGKTLSAETRATGRKIPTFVTVRAKSAVMPRAMLDLPVSPSTDAM